MALREITGAGFSRFSASEEREAAAAFCRDLADKFPAFDWHHGENGIVHVSAMQFDREWGAVTVELLPVDGDGEPVRRLAFEGWELATRWRTCTLPTPEALSAAAERIWLEAGGT